MSELEEGKLISLWIFGMITMSIGFWIAGSVEMALGATQVSYASALIVAFLLISFTGLAWISVMVDVIRG